MGRQALLQLTPDTTKTPKIRGSCSKRMKGFEALSAVAGIASIEPDSHGHAGCGAKPSPLESARKRSRPTHSVTQLSLRARGLRPNHRACALDGREAEGSTGGAELARFLFEALFESASLVSVVLCAV
jgi:hypothetical protein